MPRLKILVVFSFCLLILVFYGNRLTDSSILSSAGGITLDSPTGVSASNGDYANKVGINWDTIRGATSYRIFRNTIDDSGTATDVGTTAANYFFDSTATPAQTYFYWVRSENGGDVSAVSAAATGLRATGTAGPSLEPPVAPAANPVTATKAYLGKTLFWDEQLSSTRTVSCGTCHRPAAGGADPRSLLPGLDSTNPGPDEVYETEDDIIGSPGVPVNAADGSYGLSDYFGMKLQVTGRRAPSYLNAAYATDGLFWDGRATNVFRDPITDVVVLNTHGALESQAAGPPVSSAEMAHAGRDWNDVASQVQVSKPLALATDLPVALETWINGRTYAELFEEAFGTPDVTPARIALAIGTHERVLFSDRTPWDRAVTGIEPLTPNEEMGRKLFTINDCNFCHTEELFSDHQYHNIGVRPASDDAGRQTETGNNFDLAAFKTPSLRNAELRGAFMHNGRFATLDDVVRFYNDGPAFPAPNIDGAVIRPRKLDESEIDALVAFMSRPMTDLRVANELPPFDRPTLYTETDRVPVVSGTGRAGTGGEEPLVAAIEPPLAGNPSFTVGLSNVIPSTEAVLVINSTDPGVGATIPASGSFARETIQTSNNGSGDGFGSVSLAVPTTPDVVGTTFFGRWYVTDGAAANGFAVSQVFEFTVFGDSTAAPGGTRFDFDGDSKADISVFRRSLGEWWYLRSSDGLDGAFAFGSPTDVPVPADFTGDGIADFSFWRPATGEWFVLRSDNTGFYSFPFGANGDIPAPGDFDGDGTDDPAVFRPSTGVWYIQRSSDGGTDFVPFGAAIDKPMVGDYDGDGSDDVAIYKPDVAQFWQIRSTEGLKAFAFGAPGDEAMVADFSGDGTDDMVSWRPSTGFWFVLRSEDSNFFGFPFGATSDIPAPADYDGDGTADATVFRPTDTVWYSQQSTAGNQFTPFGASGDEPLPSVYNSN